MNTDSQTQSANPWLKLDAAFSEPVTLTAFARKGQRRQAQAESGDRRRTRRLGFKEVI